MRIVIVGKKNGKKVFCWLNILGLSVFMGLLMELGIGAGFYFLSGYWSHGVVINGLVGGVCFITVGLIRGMNTPIEELTELE